MSAPVPVQTQIVGALPVILAFFDRLGLAQTIDPLVPWQGDVPLGTLTEILVANRLLAPKPLYRIGEWAEATGLTAFYQLSAEQLNDDRLGRALERLAEHAHNVEAALTPRAAGAFDLDLAQIHYDLTSVELFGAYQDYAPAPAQPQDNQQTQPEAADAAAYQSPQPTY